MRGRRALAIVAASLALCAQGAEAQAPPSAGGQVLTFTDEVPCPPKVAAAPVARYVVHRVRRVRPAVRRAVVRKVAAPVHRRPHRVLVKHIVHRRRPALVRVAAPIAPTRCSVLRRERLTTASFGLTPEVANLAPIADTVVPGGPALVALTSGRPALPNIVNPTGGGGGPGSPGGVGSVSAAPEPQSWLLVLCGTAGLGLALRRRRRRDQLSARTAS